METINLELTKEELLVTFGALIAINNAHGVVDNEMNALISKLKSVIKDNVSPDEIDSI